MPHGPAAFDKWHGWSGSDTAASTSVLIVIPNHVDPRFGWWPVRFGLWAEVAARLVAFALRG
jgi:hypothetical protein